MFVQALAQYADRELSEDLADESWEEKPVPFRLDIDEQGRFLGLVPRMQEVTRGKKQVAVALPMLVPKSPVNRNSGLHPLLAADDIKYVLGPGPWTSSKPADIKNAEERFNAFVSLIRRAASESNDSILRACAAFYDQPLQLEKAKLSMANAKAGTFVALGWKGEMAVTESAVVRDYWRRHYRAVSEQRLSGQTGAECLISGKIGPIAPTHDKIKGLAGLGGQPSGVALMSFDKEAFRSYGWVQNENSPVAPDRAAAYVLALNQMLRPDSGHRRDIAGVAFVFWTKEPSEFDPVANIEVADEVQVSRLLALDPGADPDPNEFYLAGLGVNGARLMIRYWVAESLQTIKLNQKKWFEGLRMAGSDKSAPPRLWQLRRALHREGEPPKSQVIALLRRAIEGESKPLGLDILSAALRRLRSAPSDLSETAHYGLIRLCVNDVLRQRKEEVFMTERLDEGQNHPAYLCGRLLAVYESLQYAAFRDEGRVNSTVVDRYYALAMSNPALAFQKLDLLAKKHLNKFKGDRGWGTRVRFEKELDSLLSRVNAVNDGQFPSSLPLVDQGRFVLGYHQQRAQQFAEAERRKAEKQSNNNESEDERNEQN